MDSALGFATPKAGPGHGLLSRRLVLDVHMKVIAQSPFIDGAALMMGGKSDFDICERTDVQSIQTRLSQYFTSLR